MSALSDPETLVNHGDCIIPNELFGYVARRVYEEKTGLEISDLDSGYFDKELDTKWDCNDEEECKTRFPKLWARWGES